MQVTMKDQKNIISLIENLITKFFDLVKHLLTQQTNSNTLTNSNKYDKVSENCNNENKEEVVAESKKKKVGKKLKKNSWRNILFIKLESKVYIRKEENRKNQVIQNHPDTLTPNKKNPYSRFSVTLKIILISTSFYEALKHLPSYIRFIIENGKKKRRYNKEP